MENNYIVYAHINKSNGKVYIGQTVNIKERWRGNGKNYISSPKFYNAILKYGWDNFEHKILHSNLSKTIADSMEQKYIELYNSIALGYNIKEGGSRGKLSQASIHKMSKSIKEGYVKYPERREKIRNKALGRNKSSQTKRTMSLNNPKTILIKIDKRLGSLRYWAKDINSSHSHISKQLNKIGLEATILYIKSRM